MIFLYNCYFFALCSTDIIFIIWIGWTKLNSWNQNCCVYVQLLHFLSVLFVICYGNCYCFYLILLAFCGALFALMRRLCISVCWVTKSFGSWWGFCRWSCTSAGVRCISCLIPPAQIWLLLAPENTRVSQTTALQELESSTLVYAGEHLLSSVWFHWICRLLCMHAWSTNEAR